MTAISPHQRERSLLEQYHSVRAVTEALAAPLSAEDQQVQSMPDVSPTKWHRAHVTWFFETFVLRPFLPGYVAAEARYNFLYNSYYEAVGERHPRAERGLVTRPTASQVGTYRAAVDEAMGDLFARGLHESAEVAELIELGLNHEQQHQELLLMDIKHVLSLNGFDPAYRDVSAPVSTTPAPLSWSEHPGGLVMVGHDGDGFAFDNEGPRHETLVQPHGLAERLVTCGEWLEFMADDGYHRAELWLSDGWHCIRANGWEAPMYWTVGNDGWQVHTLNGVVPVDPNLPVVHVSYYEADAFARWAGVRLPTEFEWEVHAASVPVAGNLLSSDHLHPVASSGHPGMQQLFGDVWEWTSSSYAPYPRFCPASGAVGEYNGKFMVDQQVLRGGACVTPDGHTRPTYRNFYPARSRWMFSGVRLATDGH